MRNIVPSERIYWHTKGLRCHVSVVLLCLFAFQGFLPLTKATTVSETEQPDQTKTTNKGTATYDAGFVCMYACMHACMYVTQACSVAPQRAL